MFSLCFEHVRLLDLSFKSFLAFLFLVKGLGCVCVHTQARNMRTHTTSMHTQAYVCACILVPRNPNSSFLLLFLLLFYIICLYFYLLVCFLSFLFLCSHVCFSLYARLGFSIKVLALMLCHSFACQFNLYSPWSSSCSEAYPPTPVESKPPKNLSYSVADLVDYLWITKNLPNGTPSYLPKPQ